MVASRNGEQITTHGCNSIRANLFSCRVVLYFGGFTLFHIVHFVCCLPCWFHWSPFLPYDLRYHSTISLPCQIYINMANFKYIICRLLFIQTSSHTKKQSIWNPMGIYPIRIDSIWYCIRFLFNCCCWNAEFQLIFNLKF